MTSTYAGGPRLESTILHALTGKRVDLTRASRDRLEASGGWFLGKPDNYDAQFAVDAAQLWAFLSSTQITTDWDRDKLDLRVGSETREAYLTALRWEISRRGVVDVMQRGMSFGPLRLSLFYSRSSPNGSPRLFRQNRFTVTPHLPFSQDQSKSPLSLCLFINGLPVITMQLADGVELTDQAEAAQWYRRIALSEEPLFERGRCLAHFAVDDQQVSFCAELRELGSVFLPFNQGSSDAEPNPPRIFGVATDYLWRKIFTRRSLGDIVENYARIISEVDESTGRERPTAIFPRYHQLDMLRRLIDDIDYYGVGRRYLIQHAASSGKSQSIVWLVSQLLDLELVEMAVFGTVVLVTSRPFSDPWLPESIRQFSRISAIVDARGAERALIEELLESPNRIILVDIADFAFVLDEIKVHFHGYGYAIIIDEAETHNPPGDGESIETQVNRAMAERALLPNASYFVFSASPNAATLEIFGQSTNDHGVTRYHPFHRYGST